MAKERVTPMQEMFIAIETAMRDLTGAVTKSKTAQKKLLKKSKPFMSKLSKLVKKAGKRAGKAKHKQVQSAKKPANKNKIRSRASL
jgi:hypothetical protein